MKMPKALWLLIIGMTINITGSSFLWPLNTIYIHNELGHSLAFAGVILMLNSGAGIVGSLFGGFLFDKIGGYRSVVTGISISFFGACGLIFFHHTLSYTLLLIIIGLGSGMIFPAMYAMAGSVWREGGRKPFNALYVAQNLGVALGASSGGAIASLSFSYIFIANTVMYFAFLILAILTFKKLDPSQADLQIASPATLFDQPQKMKNKSHFISLIILCSGFFLCWIAYVQWPSTISSYTQTMGVSLSQYSLLWSINGGLIVLGQPLVSWVTKHLPSQKKQIILGILIFMVSFILLFFAKTFSGFAWSMLVLTLGEMLAWPAVPSLAQDLAPKGRVGFFQGFVNSTGTAGRMVGPLFGGIIADEWGISKLILILLVIFVGAILTTLFYDFRIFSDEKVVSHHKTA